MLRTISFLLVAAAASFAQTSPDTAVRKVLEDQVAAWNRGDIVAFMEGYDRSPETTFIGKTVQHGWQQVLDNYKVRYATRAAMGTLQFSELAVRPLGAEYASVTGRFHLARTAEGGGESAGIFSLLFHKGPQGWKIILDHTS